MISIARGRYQVSVAETHEDLQDAQSLRRRVFRNDDRADDADPYDRACTHVLVRERKTRDLVCCFRLMSLRSGDQIEASYSAQHYELSALRDFPEPIIEMGRFCVHPDHGDFDIVRVAWSALAEIVDRSEAKLLIGCTSFKGTEANIYKEAFALLRDRHLAPRRFLPKVKAPAVFRFAQALRKRPADEMQAMRSMPPLLRSYLAMGGWVSDHAVVDRDLGTLHVFTGLEVQSIPPARARLLRAAAS